MNKQPEALLRGKAFHDLVQKEWAITAEGKVKRERHIVKPNGRRGRVDIFISCNDLDAPIAIVEIKATDWDKIKKENVNRYIKRQIRQIWSYIESQIVDGEFTLGGEQKEVCPGIVFPHTPKNMALKQMIVSEFEDYGIAVVWHDEK